MDRTTLATATSLTLMAMLSIPLAYAAGDPDPSTSAAVTKSQSDDQSKTNAADTKMSCRYQNGTEGERSRRKSAAGKASSDCDHGPGDFYRQISDREEDASGAWSDKRNGSRCARSEIAGCGLRVRTRPRSNGITGSTRAKSDHLVALKLPSGRAAVARRSRLSRRFGEGRWVGSHSSRRHT